MSDKPIAHSVTQYFSLIFLAKSSFPRRRESPQYIVSKADPRIARPILGFAASGVNNHY
ncbi:hypothetical protein BN1221_03153c [Brenneria goodwinii]|uniref:Uncharacterized protein n=1 Tax=Brenneria goodwinii TaxID=1109412 RepID=A0A0G4JXJ8_9GAMM|nr:hypothetical protein BN1221_03153c [Brenneria goodwinii]